MKSLKYFLFIIFLNSALTLLSACQKEEVDPKLEADLDETVKILESYLQRPEEFDVYIYVPFTTNPDDYFLKTTNHQIYFEQHTLIVKPDKQRFPVDKFKLLRSESEHISGNPSEADKIKRLELYFKSAK